MNVPRRINLAEILSSDITEEYLDTLNDTEYMKYSRNAAFVHTLSTQVQYIANLKLSHNLIFGIKNAVDGKMLGTVNCYVDFVEMTLDLGFLVFKNYQGKGYASEALGLFIEYLEVQFPGMTAVIGSNKDNFAMHEVAKKLNFQIDPCASQGDDSNLRFSKKLSALNSQSLPLIPDFLLNAKRIGVAANDAGGAERISWLLQNLPQRVLAYIDGPALQIFRGSEFLFDEVSQLSEIMECDLIITGSGWMSQLEVNAIQEARLRNIPCVTVLDHWVNYLERFGDDENGKPQILAVTNSIALTIAQEKFPNRVVWLLPDLQIENYRQVLNQIERSPTCVLVLLEPISNSNSMFAINNEATRNLINSAISLKRVNGYQSVVLRLHPSQLVFPMLLEEFKNLNVELEVSKGDALLTDLGNSAAVLGLSSYALYISAMCEIDTYSPFAGMEGHWTNYFPQIKNLGC